MWLPCGRQVSKVFFSPEEVEALDRLAKSGGFYRIRAPTSIHEQTENHVMSFVIVGVGNADFAAMDVLDADDTPLQVRKTPSWPRSWANFSLL